MRIQKYYWALLISAFITYIGFFVFFFKNLKLFSTINEQQKNVSLKESTKKDYSCAINGIYRKVSLDEDEEAGCQGHVSSSLGCMFVKKTYPYDSNSTCKRNQSLEICKFQKRKTLLCAKSNCANEPVLIHVIDPKSGKTTVAEDSYKTDEELSNLVLKYAKQSVENGFRFLFLSCGKYENKTQLLILENYLFAKPKVETNAPTKRKININLVMIDSVSRAHFYRSLQKTTKTLSEINLMSDTEVLDFEKYQAVHGHSMENSRALFTGDVFPSNYTEDIKESMGVGIEAFMSHFKNLGYHTFFQDDMCWESVWGIRLDLGNPEDWVELLEKINQSGIQDTGLLHSNCKVLTGLGLETVFNTEKEEMVCFNNQQHDYYYLNYVENYYKSIPEDQHTVSYTALMVAHDSGGIRIQTIDEDLSHFVKEMSVLDNTLTVIFADHGNAYTDFVYRETDGRYEMFHPSMFMVIPKGVKDYIGDEEIRNLRRNQMRLFTLVDFNKMLFYFARKYVDPPSDKNLNRGLAEIIPNNRSCDELPLVMPNLCICQNFHSEVKNDSSLLGYLEFAVGKINNMITNSSLSYACKRLVPLWFENVRKKKDGEFVLTNFDIFTSPGLGSSNNIEKVNVVIKSIESDSINSFAMKLVGWDRISKFGGYRKCSDADQQFRLCVCDLKNSNKKRKFQSLYNSSRISPRFNLLPYVIKEKVTVLKKKRLFLIARTLSEQDKDKNLMLVSVTFEAVSVSTQSYYVKVKVNSLDNLKPSAFSACHGNVRNNSVIYLCTYSRIVSDESATISYSAFFKEV